VKISPVDPELPGLRLKKNKKLRKLKYIARLASLPSRLKMSAPSFSARNVTVYGKGSSPVYLHTSDDRECIFKFSLIPIPKHVQQNTKVTVNANGR